jgi:hypothetical protein
VNPNEHGHFKVGDYVTARTGGIEINNHIGQIKKIDTDGVDRWFATVEWANGTSGTPYLFVLKKVDPLTLLAMQLDKELD